MVLFLSMFQASSVCHFQGPPQCWARRPGRTAPTEYHTLTSSNLAHTQITSPAILKFNMRIIYTFYKWNARALSNPAFYFWLHLGDPALHIMSVCLRTGHRTNMSQLREDLGSFTPTDMQDLTLGSMLDPPNCAISPQVPGHHHKVVEQEPQLSWGCQSAPPLCEFVYILLILQAKRKSQKEYKSFNQRFESKIKKDVIKLSLLIKGCQSGTPSHLALYKFLCSFLPALVSMRMDTNSYYQS